MPIKHTALDSPVKGTKYWVIRYPQDLDEEYPVEPEDFCTATYLGNNTWRNNLVQFKSPYYMETPTL